MLMFVCILYSTALSAIHHSSATGKPTHELLRDENTTVTHRAVAQLVHRLFKTLFRQWEALGDLPHVSI